MKPRFGVDLQAEAWEEESARRNHSGRDGGWIAMMLSTVLPILVLLG